MTEVMKPFFDDLIRRYPALQDCRPDMEKAVLLLYQAVQNNGKILICGNGGSAADADHIVGELMKGFIKPRPLTKKQKEALIRADSEKGRQMSEVLQQGIPAVSLCSPTALNTAFMNDVDPSLIYAQQLMGLGKEGDILWALSTSGNSSNVVAAAIAAKAGGLPSIAMTGEKESRLSELCDVCIRVKAVETYMIQELHLPIYHCICLILEEKLFNKAL